MNRFNFFKKIIFSFRRPKIIIVGGRGRQTTAEALFCVLKKNFRVEKLNEKFPNIFDIYKKDILILETELTKSTPVEKVNFLVQKSQLPILVITHFGDIPPAAHSSEPRPQSGRDKDFFAGDEKDVTQFKKLAKILPAQGHIILNFDDETVREIKEETNLRDYNPPTTPSHILTFGFQEGADFQATDIKLNSGTNFKINYKGNSVPIWLEKLFGKEQIYSALAAAAVGTIFDLNLVEISNILRNHQSSLSREYQGK